MVKGILALGLMVAGWCPSVAFAQVGEAESSGPKLSDEYVLRLRDTVQGLPESSSTAIAQTEDGHLWVGTFNGLGRFDGLRFAAFSPANLPELPSEGIVNLHLDGKGRLWVSTLRGMTLLEGGRWRNLGSSPVGESNFSRTISDQAGVVCVTSYDGRVYRSTGDRLEELPAPPGIKGSGYYGHVDRTGTIWAGQTGFFGHWDGNAWVRSPLEPSLTNQFCGMGNAGNGDLWVVANGHLSRLDAGRLAFRAPLAEKTGLLWQLYEDRQANVWLATQQNGLYRVGADGVWRHFSTANGLPADSVRCVLEDREGNLWLGGSGDGVAVLVPRRFRSPSMDPLAPVKRVTAILAELPGQALLGSYGGGLARFSAGQVRRKPAVVEGRETKHIQALCRDASGSLWIGTYQEGVRVFREDGSSELIPAGVAGGKEVAALFRDSKDRIWIGGSETVTVFEAGRFRSFDGPRPGPGRVKSFTESPVDGSLWAATPEGVFRFDGETWSEIRDAEDRPLRESVCVLAAADGAVWIGGSIVPLRRWRAGKMSALAETNGLPVGNVSAILDDLQGHWWLGSRSGVVRVSPTELDAVADGSAAPLRALVLDESDGLPSAECVGGFQSTAAVDPAGRVWFATSKGPAWIDPRVFQPNTNPPPVVIQEFRIESLDKVQTRLIPSAGERVVVPAGQRELAVFFAALTFSAPEKVRFSYRIEGVHDEWSSIGSRRSLFFFPPAPGRYRFWIKAANNDGFWNETGASVAFVVQPFYWQTLWFRGLALVGLIGGTGATVWRIGRGRLRRRIEQLEQQALIERERSRLAAILESTSDLVAFADPAGRLLYLNPAGRVLLGFGKDEEISGRTLRELLPSPEVERLFEQGRSVADQAGTWSGETVLRHRDGREIPASQVLVSHRSTDGPTDWISAIARDISEQRRVQTERQRLVHDLGERVKELTALHRAARLLQDERPFSRELLEEMAALLPPAWQYPEITAVRIRFDDMEVRSLGWRETSWSQNVGFQVKDGRRGAITVVYLEERLADPDGPFLAEERTLLESLADMLAAYLDRKAAEGALQAVHRRYLLHEAAISALSRSYALRPEDLDGVLLRIVEVVAGALEVSRVSLWRHDESKASIKCVGAFDCDGRLPGSGHELSRRGMESYFEALDGSDLVAVADVTADPRLVSLVRDHLAPLGIGALLDVPLRSRGVTVGVLCCEHRGAQRRWTTDEQTFAIAVANLVSMLFAQLEQQRLEVQLRHAQKLESLGTLAGGIAHDFNNILGAIISSSELVSLDRPRDMEVQENIGHVLKAARRAVDLVRQILAFSRNEKVERGPLPLGTVVKEVLRLIRPTLPATIEIRSEVAARLPLVEANATQMHQVLMNLCTNAGHAMRGRLGVLRIAVEHVAHVPGAPDRMPASANGFVQLTVVDTGHGMEPEVLRRIFDPFYTTKGLGEGTGLGLAVVHGIVKEHQGTMDVSSEPGVGTTFRICLPALSAPESAGPSDGERGPMGRGHRILFVDDEIPLAESARLLLGRYGFEVEVCNRPDEALAVLARAGDRFDAVITDLTMPVMTGAELVKHVRRSHPKLPVLVMTGYSGELDAQSAKKAGFSALVAKPVDYRELASILVEMIASQSRSGRSIP